MNLEGKYRALSKKQKIVHCYLQAATVNLWSQCTTRDGKKMQHLYACMQGAFGIEGQRINKRKKIVYFNWYFYF